MLGAGDRQPRIVGARVVGVHEVGVGAVLDALEEHGLSENTLVYILAHDSRDAAQEGWAAFREDPDWARAAEESQRDGRLVESVDVLWLEATDYSKIK